VLRLPYRAISATIEDLFGEQITAATIMKFVGDLSDHYVSTEKQLLARIQAGGVTFFLYFRCLILPPVVP